MSHAGLTAGIYLDAGRPGERIEITQKIHLKAVLKMVESTPLTQTLEKSDNTKQYVVSLPGTYPLRPLEPNAIRIRSIILSLTANNFTHARLGYILGLWDVWPAPPSLPSPYNDTQKYGRILPWSYAEVIGSTSLHFPAGTKLWGYMPLGTHPEDLEVTIGHASEHSLEVSERGRHLLSIYNRYLAYPPDTDLPTGKHSFGWDAMMRVLFESSYMLSRCGFSWAEMPVHPLGTKMRWSNDDTDIADAVAVLLALSRKTGLSFPYQLRHGWLVSKQPRKAIAVGLAKSRVFSEIAGLFDEVLLYDDFTKSDLSGPLGTDKATKVLLSNFGATSEADEKWASVLKPLSARLQVLLIGSHPKVKGRGKLATHAKDPASGIVQMNMTELRGGAIVTEGEARHFDLFDAEWTRFKSEGAVPGLKLTWGKGMDQIRKG